MAGGLSTCFDIICKIIMHINTVMRFKKLQQGLDLSYWIDPTTDSSHHFCPHAADGGGCVTLEGDDSAGADSGRRRGGTGGGTGGSSVLLWKLTMEDTDDDPARESERERGQRS